MDTSKLTELMTDLFEKRDFNALAMVVALAIGAYVVMFLATKVVVPAAKGTAKLGWRGAKWLVTSKPPSELAQTLLTTLTRTDGTMLNETDMKVGDVIFWCHGNSTKFSEMRACNGDNKDFSILLSGRDRRRVFRSAYQTRKQVKERDAQENVAKYLVMLKTKKEECSPLEDNASMIGCAPPVIYEAVGDVPVTMTRNAEVVSAKPVNCPCPDCAAARSKKGT